MNPIVKTFFKTSLLFILIAMLSGCKSGMVISHGSSFGHCRGFCNKELKLMEKKTNFSTWENGGAGVKNVLEVATIGTDFNKIASQIDEETFKKLKSTYGCPDCADGGAEWIEIKAGMKTKRVTFEYGNPPEELKALNEQLRLIQQQYDKSK
jgi:hypothetical protein